VTLPGAFAPASIALGIISELASLPTHNVLLQGGSAWGDMMYPPSPCYITDVQ